jgi:hypothetical protein
VSSAAQTPRRSRSLIAGVTRSDRATASLIAACVVLGTALFYLVAVWISNLLPSRTIAAAPLEIVEEGFGGDPEGAPGESLLIESPEPESPDATKGEDFAEVADVPDVAMVENVADLATDIVAAVDADPNGEGPAIVRAFQAAPLEVRKPGSSKGTGNKRPLGFGPGSKGGVPREMRWFVKFSERGTLDDYAAQLDFFGIELGALLPDGKLVLISKFTGARPISKTVNSGADEKRLYFTWRGGSRKAGDLELFQKAGVNAGNATMILHFYPPQTENQLATLELQHKNRKAIEIKRTYFVVRRAKDGYEFAVSSQTYLK